MNSIAAPDTNTTQNPAEVEMMPLNPKSRTASISRLPHYSFNSAC